MNSLQQSVKIRKNAFETAAWAQNLIIAGIDEVGRGCLAGPVVAAAVILPPNKKHPLLKDSKIMTPAERLIAYKWIKKHCWYATGIIHNRLIDKHNIWHATLIAMKKAIINILEISPHKPSAIVIDAMPLKLTHTSFHDIPIYHFYKGESKSISIAAASIVAKVTRDAMMELFNSVAPGYSLANNKGYGTATHKHALTTNHISIIHRLRFLPNALNPQTELETQLSLDSFITITERINDDTQGELLCRSD